ncbi:retinol dehydrogenase 14 [Ampelomyces quisqualis]|uniref:Retinol dehydrogenase 14 n=1 Tax=Ampelomyces quisqualis TaxID=50730 RepID=A0A6A5QSE6_AMPQU|nr:retinol dehydrogenase 14 [Ampelomyces quisqualis]
MSTISYNPEKDIPSQAGRVFLITGGTTGLGASAISFIAAQNPEHIFFSGRNQKRASEVISGVQQASPSTKLTFLECDLSSLASVKSSALEFLSKSSRLDVLMCNAGVMALPASQSKDGYEIHFATNHLGHALLTKLLLPTMLSTAEQPESDVRIINLSSVAYNAAPPSGIEFSKLQTPNASYGAFYVPTKWVCYGQSKLANLLYSVELAARYPSITSVAVHPGIINTALHDNNTWVDRQMVNFMADKWLDEKQGAYNQTWAATTKKEDLVSGGYYEPVGRKTVPGTKAGRDEGLARELWEWTEGELERWV